MRFFRPPVFSRLIYPEALFRIKTKENEICLTFDDGPDPDSTPKILDILENYKVKSIFFCNGQAAAKYPGLMADIRSNGHKTGNHGFSHLNGWKSPVTKYVADVGKAAEFTSASLFRPPYGALRLSQYHILKKTYDIVFWDLMPYDFDLSTGKERSLGILKKKLRKGSVIVLHDKVASSALSFLEEFLDFCEKEGYRFVIPAFSKQGTGMLP